MPPPRARGVRLETQPSSTQPDRSGPVGVVRRDSQPPPVRPDRSGPVREIRTRWWRVHLDEVSGGALSWELQDQTTGIALLTGTARALWTGRVEVEGKPVQLEGRITRVTQDDQGTSVRWEAPLVRSGRLIKEYHFEANTPIVVVRVRVENGGSRPVRVGGVDLGWGPGLGADAREQKENARNLRALGGAPVKAVVHTQAGEYPGPWNWVGVDNRYFLAAILADHPFTSMRVSGTKGGPYEVSVSTALEAPAGGSVEWRTRLFVGVKRYDELRTIHPGLERSVDFGFFGGIGKVMLRVLNATYRVTRNYGWSIIILVTAIQILLLPLALKSMGSMQKMKELQPKMSALRAKYQGDQKRLNQEMMHLYKTEKINPFGGCLPMLPQIPIFWALFTTLRNAIELRHAPFLLWIRDLSAPDTMFYLVPPSGAGTGVAFNLLPALMGVTMFVQQKMSVPSAPEQKMMVVLMPVMFTFIFWGFPSGLVLYWLVNNLFTITEQWLIMRRTPSLA